jgi:cysteinyl-tRNA synthetase
VHHSNEIAQTQACHGTRLANFWMHGRFLTTGDDAKMSKSAGDFLRMQTLIDRGIDPLAYRYLCLTAHYRSELRFTFDALDAAQAALARLRTAYSSWPEGGAPDAGFVARFRAEADQDLNLPRALAVLWELVRSDLPLAVRRATVDRFDVVLGLRLADWKAEDVAIPSEVAALLSQRNAARSAKNWELADELRERLQQLGWRVEDSASGQRVTRSAGNR